MKPASFVSPGFILVLLVLAALAVMPLFVQSDYYIAYSINVLQYGVLATAWTLFSGPTRYISLATTAFSVSAPTRWPCYPRHCPGLPFWAWPASLALFWP